MTTPIADVQSRNDWRRGGVVLVVLFALLIGGCVALVADANSDNDHGDDVAHDDSPSTTVAETTTTTTTTTAAPTTTVAAAADAGTVELVFGADGALVLRGVVPSQDVVDRLIAAAELGYPTFSITNELTIDDGVAADDVVVTVSGEAENVAAADQRVLSAQAFVDAYVGDSGGSGSVIDAQTFGSNTREEQAFEDDLNRLARLNPITFAVGSAELTAEGQATLDEAIAIFSESSSTAPVLVEGHTDAQGSDDANLELSRQRAEAVVAYLVNGGVAAERLSAEGLGETRPIADNATAEGRAQNRRIEFRVNP